MPLTIKNALIVTMNDRNDVFLGDIKIDGHQISEITRRPAGAVPAGPIKPPREVEGRTEVDGNGCLAFPGFVNGHIHSYRNVLRYVPEEFDFPRHHGGQPDLTLAEAEAILRLSYLEGVKAGVTFCCDFPQWLKREDFPPPRPFEIAHEIGIKGCIRVVLSHDSYDDANRKYFTDPGRVIQGDEDQFIDNDRAIIKQVAETVRSFPSGSDSYQIGIWIPWETRFRAREKNKFNERTLSFLERLIRTCAHEEWIDGVRLVALMHHAENRSSASFSEFERLLTQYEAIAERLVLFHSIHIRQEDIDLIAEHELRAITCPKFSDGRLAPIRRMLDAGIPIGLGTDYGAWDLFPAIGLLPRLHRLFGKGKQERGVDIVESLRMATSGGAQVYQIDDCIGSIEENKRADILLIGRSTLPLCLPPYMRDGLGPAVVDQFLKWDAIRSSDIHTVIIDGDIVIFDHKPTRQSLEENVIVSQGSAAIRSIHERIRERHRKRSNILEKQVTTLKTREILKIFRTLHRLKELPRQGFVYFGFKGDETDSIAEHSFMVAWIAHVIGLQFGLSSDEMARVTLMALIHDWGEAVTGDFSYSVKDRYKFVAGVEEQAFAKLIEKLEHNAFLKELWLEYDARRTRAAGIVKFADILDAWLQGLVTPTTWWPAWEDRKRSVLAKMVEVDPDLAESLPRICDLASDPNIQVWLPKPELDAELWPAVKFFKEIYCLKELPRHGFALFGMKRNETDSFAGHGFTTACLAFLIALEHTFDPASDIRALMDVVMVSLSHDLPVARTGDAAYDFQTVTRATWHVQAKAELSNLVRDLHKRETLEKSHTTWLNLEEPSAWITRVAASVDAWEMGVTTPSSWMHAWLDYREQTLNAFKTNRGDAAPKLMPLLEQAYEELSEFEDLSSAIAVGRSPKMKPIRLTRLEPQ